MFSKAMYKKAFNLWIWVFSNNLDDNETYIPI